VLSSTDFQFLVPNDYADSALILTSFMHELGVGVSGQPCEKWDWGGEGFKEEKDKGIFFFLFFFKKKIEIV
jgi:hypothetical protein